MMQAKTQVAIEAINATILALGKAEGPTKRRRALHEAPRASRPSLKWPTFPLEGNR